METDINTKWGLELVGERKGGGLSFYSSFSFIWVGFLSLFFWLIGVQYFYGFNGGPILADNMAIIAILLQGPND